MVENCECCPVPCCDYCGVLIAWNVVISATRTINGIKETVSANWNFVIHFVRDDSDPVPQPPPALPPPPTFRVVELIGENQCQLVSNPNAAPWLDNSPGSYTFTREEVSTGTILLEEEAELIPRLDAFDINVNCHCESLEGAGDDPNDADLVRSDLNIATNRRGRSGFPSNHAYLLGGVWRQRAASI